jgi:SAM-dependent methyltransferase
VRESGVDPADFYTGLVAELYAPLRSADPDPEPYARFIALSGEPALELGCGDGDPLLDLRRRGLDVEGVDSSADMLDRCRRAAAEAGLEVVLHRQKIEELNLGRRYRTIFLAGATFNLLPDDEAAGRALERIRDHLDEGGSALIPLLIPAPTTADHLGKTRESTESDGAVIRVSAIAEHRDDVRRTQETTLRYERLAGDRHVTLDRVWLLHWHTQEGFRALVDATGLSTVDVLDVAGRPATPDSDTFVFWLQAAT